ncbi:undecaprenyldiphospho-muramoylpentapeptide beta-N-acetylglucosaminyltransferase [bacterium]|nr:undecaprenyldiphospho-muramoylpentapeptide beta-N-acetylglucosaminyltransferase [bacterium]
MSDTCNSKKVYFITGGGTGGHIYPAVAICDELLKDSDTDIYYVGNPKNMEYRIATDKGYKFLPVVVSAMPRKVSLSLLGWGFQLFCAVCKSMFFIKKYKPKAILGTGGYVSAPALMAGIVNRVPVMIHDCDAIPGIVSRQIAPKAQRVSLAFEKALERIKTDKAMINGNPLREEFKTLTKEQARANAGLQNKLTLCVMGGSQGAKSINGAFVHIIERLSKEHDLQIVFQTGAKKYDETISVLKEVYPDYLEDKNVVVRPFFDNMTEILKSADIAVSRAGSLSLSELCASAVAPILIPYPNAAADHQRKNAKFMVEKRAALYLEDADVTRDTLLIAIEKLLDDRERLETIQKNIYLLAKPDATKNIVAQLREISGGR